MKKGMLVVLALFAVLFVSSVGADTQVQTQSSGAMPAADTDDNFVVVDHFKVPQSIFTEDPPPPVKFSDINDIFQSWFYGKIENKKTAVLPKSHCDLSVDASDEEIIAALGGEAKAETSMFGIYKLLKRQSNGQSGVMLTNGYANIFYVRDAKSALRVIGVRWLGDGWGVYADLVKNPYRWYPGRRVFYH